jgi:hypothetical protein
MAAAEHPMLEPSAERAVGFKKHGGRRPLDRNYDGRLRGQSRVRRTSLQGGQSKLMTMNWFANMRTWFTAMRDATWRRLRTLTAKRLQPSPR